MANATRLISPLRLRLHQFTSERSQCRYVCRHCQSAVGYKSSLSRRRVDSSRSFSTSYRRQADSEDKDDFDDLYVPAENWDGLEWIGSKDWLYARDARLVEHKRFGASESLAWDEQEEIAARLRRAVVETFTLSKAGKTPLGVFSAPTALDDAIDHTLDVELKVSRDGQDAALVFRSADAKRKLYESLGIEEDLSGTSAPNEAENGSKESWQELGLASSELKFAILKRLQQLAGLRLPDAVINSSSTPGAILAALTEKPTPANVLQVLQEDTRFEGVNNVTVYGQRQSRFDQDRAIGRWKTIERELRKYELPIPGVREAR